MSKRERGDSVYVSLGITKNIGNYESVRIDAGISLEINDEESVDDAYVRAWNAVEAQVDKQISELNEEIET